MNGSIPIGTLFGVPLRAHWSVLVLVALLGWSLGARTLPLLLPGRSNGVYPVAAVLAALALVLSLLLHESAHAVIALRKGVKVEDMTLWALGGVTRMGRIETASAQLVISGSGPLTSLLLGGIGIGAGEAVQAVSGANVAAVVFFWLGQMNLVLGVFNLLPGSPLDGGRIVQALLWRRSGDRERSEQTAARGGQVVGVLLALVGAWAFLRGSAGGLWLLLIGFFLSATAGAEIRRATLSARGARGAGHESCDPGASCSYCSSPPLTSLTSASICSVEPSDKARVRVTVWPGSSASVSPMSMRWLPPGSSESGRRRASDPSAGPSSHEIPISRAASAIAR